MKASLPVWLLACIWGQQMSGRGGGGGGGGGFVGRMRQWANATGAEQQHLAQPEAPTSISQSAGTRVQQQHMPT